MIIGCGIAAFLLLSDSDDSSSGDDPRTGEGGDLIVSADGVGDLTIGTPLSEGENSELVASTGTGCELSSTPPTNAELAPPLEGTAEFYAPTGEGEQELVAMTFTDGVVTEEGIEVGSTADEVVDAYPDATVIPLDPNDTVFMLSTIVLGTDDDPGVTFRLDQDDGEVISISVPRLSFCE